MYMSRRKRPEAMIPPTRDAERFMALLLHAQSCDHNCIFAGYFRELGRRMIKEHIKEAEQGG